ncbi:C2 family cysteine protease [Actinacidiphila oryziradicis]|uniref:C2 family cysteine protease n=1 Tax=Actinacidiphila oryziradicis TaxID=2571141 RepID=UPI0023F2D9D8|nr:C2 family cysteine protease [Actinacidiphila oryziradicis]
MPKLARDPGFFQQHIRENPNGTYTVTLYRSEGFPPQTVPVEVTVDNQLPSDASGNPAYAQTPDNVMWVAIYEKAYAQFKGGYGNIDGGWGDVGLHDLTGQPTDRLNAGDLSLNDINEKIKQGDAITTGSKDDNFLWWSGDEYVDGGKIVTSHEYSIERVDMNAHPPTITLLNPWGTNGAAPQEITLTEDEWHKYYNEIGITKTKV